MNIDQYEHRMILALEGELSTSDYDQLMKEIVENESLASVWASFQEMYQEMDAFPMEKPSAQVKERFTDFLDSYDEPKVISIAPVGVKKGPIIHWRRWAGVAAIFVCVFGFWKFYEHNQSVETSLASMSKQMEVLMDQKSSTERIKAIRVNYDPQASNVDNQMINVLIGVLNEDQSSNVRLAAVETLANYIDQDLVREALIKRLASEGDGSVKLSIITSLGQQKNDNIKTTLEKIVNDDSQQKFVIDEAHMQLIRYDQIDI